MTVGSALQGTDSPQGFTTLLCINPQILEHPYSAPVSNHEPKLCSEGANVNQLLVCVLCFRAVSTVTTCTIIATHQIL